MDNVTPEQYSRICDLLWRMYTSDWEGFGELRHTSDECRRVANLIVEVFNG